MPTETTTKRAWLIAGWRYAWRLTSVQAAAALAVLSMLQAEVLPFFQFAVPPQWWPWVSACFAVAIVVLRIVAQPNVLAPNEVPSDGGTP